MIKWMPVLLLISANAFANEGGAHHGEEGIPYKLILTQSVNLLIFVGLMVYFLRETLAKHFADRKKSFHELVNRAENARREAEGTRREIATKVSRIESTAQSSMKQAEQEAEEMRKKIVNEGAALSQRMQAEAQKTAQVEVERARNELRAEVLQIATEQTEKMLREKVGETEKKRLQNEFVEKFQVVR